MQVHIFSGCSHLVRGVVLAQISVILRVLHSLQETEVKTPSRTSQSQQRPYRTVVDCTRVENDGNSHFSSLGIFGWLGGLIRKFRSKQNTDKPTLWVFIEHHTTTAVKGTMALHAIKIFVHFVVNLAYSLLEWNAFLTNLAVASIYR